MRKLLFFILSFIWLTTYGQSILEKNVNKCLNIKDFEYLDFTPFPGTPTYRDQLVGNEKNKKISLKEAYRIRYSYKKIKFMDLKIEYSIPEKYEKDKKYMKKYFKYIKKVESKTAFIQENNNFMSFSGFISERFELKNEFLFLSSYCFFDDVNKRIIYVYYWNINQQQKVFKTIDEFKIIRDESIKIILDCIK